LGGVRDLVEIATATSPGVRVTTRILLVLWASFSVAGMTAIILDQRAMDWAETALWTVSGPPCQPHGEVFFKAPLGRPATITFAGGEPHCVLGTNFPAALFDS
jgi:hypothetical protein